MALGIALCRELWKYRGKKLLQQIMHQRRHQSRFIAFGKPALASKL
jgi:hypothetical protein